MNYIMLQKIILNDTSSARLWLTAFPLTELYIQSNYSWAKKTLFCFGKASDGIFWFANTGRILSNCGMLLDLLPITETIKKHWEVPAPFTYS